MLIPASNQAIPATQGAATATQPTLSVSGRTDGEAYTVSAGARSITITAEAGATLSTKVEQASDGSSISVTDSTTDTPDWTAPSGSTTGEAVQVQVTATKDGLTSQVSWTERVAGSGGGTSWTTLLDYDFTDLTTASAITTGTTTLAFDSTADTIDVTVTSFNGNNGTWTPTNGTGLVGVGNSGSGATTAAFAFVAELAATWDAEYVSESILAVDVYVDAVTYTATGDYIFAGLSPNTTHNSGGTRVWYMARDTVSTDEDRRTRNNSSNGSVIDTVTIKTTRVFTFTLDTSLVHLADTSGTTAPADPSPFTAGMTCAGGDGAAQQATGTTFSSDAYAVMSVGQRTEYNITRLRVRRIQ